MSDAPPAVIVAECSDPVAAKSPVPMYVIFITNGLIVDPASPRQSAVRIAVASP
jgi:hypothetical protein